MSATDHQFSSTLFGEVEDVNETVTVVESEAVVEVEPNQERDIVQTQDKVEDKEKNEEQKPHPQLKRDRTAGSLSKEKLQSVEEIDEPSKSSSNVIE